MFNLHCVGKWVCVLGSEKFPNRVLPSNMRTTFLNMAYRSLSGLTRPHDHPGVLCAAGVYAFSGVATTSLAFHRTHHSQASSWDLTYLPPLTVASHAYLLVYLDNVYSLGWAWMSSPVIQASSSLHRACHLVHCVFGHPEHDSHTATATPWTISKVKTLDRERWLLTWCLACRKYSLYAYRVNEQTVPSCLLPCSCLWTSLPS